MASLNRNQPTSPEGSPVRRPAADGWRVRQRGKQRWRALARRPAPVARVRVLHVHVLPAPYGSGLNTFLSMRYLDRRRYEPALACAPGGALEDMVRAEGFGFHAIENFVRPIDPRRDSRALVELVRCIRRGNYDLIHTHNSKGGFLGRLAGKITRVPVVHTVHGFAFHDAESRWKRTLYRQVERRAARWCDAMIAISTPLIRWAERERVAPSDAFVRIPSGIELEHFSTRVNRDAVRDELGIKRDESIVIEVAKLWEGKGHETLLESFAPLARSHPNARLVFAGEGPLEGRLRERADALGLRDRVLFLGHRDDIERVLAACDIAALPSEFEGMGRVVLEAMARGLPVVATDVGGIPDLVRDGQTGILVPPRDPRALTGALGRLLDDACLRERFGIAARDAIRSDRTGFNARQMAARIEEVYRGVLARRGLMPSGEAGWAQVP